jgi:hypothetical protein
MTGKVGSFLIIYGLKKTRNKHNIFVQKLNDWKSGKFFYSLTVYLETPRLGDGDFKKVN